MKISFVIIMFSMLVLPVFSRDFNFDRDRAFKYLEYQCDLGPRPPQSEALEKLKNFIIKKAEDNSLTVERDDFTYKDKIRNKELRLTNIMARYNPLNPRRILLLTHFDTRFWADNDPDEKNHQTPIIGANDGGSGTAVLLEMMNVISLIAPGVGVDFLFLDGEDYGTSEHIDQYCLGAQHYTATYPLDGYMFGILIDLVGKCNSEYYIEGYSQKYANDIVEMVWATAAEINLDNFHNELKHTVIDDHIYFNYAGLKTIDIIDFDYEYWHTVKDTRDKCCPESLEEIGFLLEAVLGKFK